MMFVFVLLSCCLIGSSTADIGWFWHVTDFHYDFTYHGKQLSCHGQNLSNPGEFGDYWCDSPWALITSSVRAMKAIKSDVDFLIWTGDSVLHGKDADLSTQTNDDILGNITDLLTDNFPGKSVYASFGNHDYWPNNQFPPENNLLYNLTLARWRAWINQPSQEANFLIGGYYTVVLPSGLRMVALNTNLYYTSNKAAMNETDPAGQFHWLEEVLNASRTANQKVIITAHIPPGVHTPNGLLWMFENFAEKMHDIIVSYSDVISSMHYGHDHADGFKVYSNNAGNPAVSMFIAPSVTPWRYKIPTETGPPHNPGVRLVKYDKQTGDTLDILQYYLDLPSANKQQNATWKLEYTATSDYNVVDLKPTSLYQLSVRMKGKNSEELSNFIKWYTVSTNDQYCDLDCEISILCGFTNFNMAAFNKCKNSFYTSSAPVLSLWNGLILLFLSCLCAWYLYA